MIQSLPKGYRARPATQANANSVCELWNARSQWVRNTSPYNEAAVGKRWDNPRFNLETDSLLVFDSDSKLVGYAHIKDVKNPPVDVFSGYSIHPDWDDQPWLWNALFDWIENEARRVIPKAPAGTLIALIAGTADDDPSAQTQLETYGFLHSRTFHRMAIQFTQPIASPPLLKGITIRPFVLGVDDEALVHAYRDAFRDHYGHLEQPFEVDLAKWRCWMEDDDFDPNLWFLATDTTAGGEVVGYCCCYPADRGDEEMGLIDEIGVRGVWRRRGIARTLLLHALKVLQQRGLEGANLGVDAESKNRAITLYKSVGMHVISSSHTYVKELRPGVNLVTQ